MEKWFAMIEKHRQEMQDVLDFMWENPETGYREWKANAYLKEAYEKLGYRLVMAGDIPGFYTDLDTGRPGPKILILGELDSLICLEHPDADPETGAVHACGHCAQSAALLGLAAALKEPGALDGLSRFDPSVRGTGGGAHRNRIPRGVAQKRDYPLFRRESRVFVPRLF